jgi:hypothetical protein
MLSGETAADHRLLFDNLRKEWSNSLKTQLQVAQR